MGIELQLRRRALASLSAAELRYLKQKGFSDRRLAKLLKTNSTTCVRAGMRWACGRSTSASTPAPPSSPRKTAYMYSTYDEECEAEPTDRKKIMVLGGGPNRIGQGIEFDYCCVHAALAMREDGYETIMVNCNPETVSTDYDTSDRLYFEPVTLEDVLEIVDKEKPLGVIVQYGGQTPLKLALDARSQRRADHRHQPRQHRHRRGPRALPEAAASAGAEAAAEPHRAHRGSGAGTGAADRLPAGGAAQLRARRPRDGDRARRQGPGALHARGRASVATSRRCCWTVFSTTRSRSTWTASAIGTT